MFMSYSDFNNFNHCHAFKVIVFPTIRLTVVLSSLTLAGLVDVTESFTGVKFGISWGLR